MKETKSLFGKSINLFSKKMEKTEEKKEGSEPKVQATTNLLFGRPSDLLAKASNAAMKKPKSIFGK